MLRGVIYSLPYEFSVNGFMVDQTTPPIPRSLSPDSNKLTHATRLTLPLDDPFLTLSASELASAIQAYREEIAIYYPLTAFESLLFDLSLLSASIDARDGTFDCIETPWTDERDLAVVRVLVSCGLEIRNERCLSVSLYEGARTTIEASITDHTPTIKNVILLGVAVCDCS